MYDLTVFTFVAISLVAIRALLVIPAIVTEIARAGCAVVERFTIAVTKKNFTNNAIITFTVKNTHSSMVTFSTVRMMQRHCGKNEKHITMKTFLNFV